MGLKSLFHFRVDPATWYHRRSWWSLWAQHVVKRQMDRNVMLSLGSNVELTWCCQSGHGRKWVSSETLPSKKRGTIALNDGLLASAVVISGNNYSKFSLLCQALGMQIISEALFLRFQKHCAAPVIEEVWLEMNELVKQIFKDYEEICLCGDGRNDSPGHSPRYCVYTLVEHFTSAVVDF